MSGVMGKFAGKGDGTPGTLGPCAAGWPGSQPSTLRSLEQVTQGPRRPSCKPAPRGSPGAREEASFRGPAPVHQGLCCAISSSLRASHGSQPAAPRSRSRSHSRQAEGTGLEPRSV